MTKDQFDYIKHIIEEKVPIHKFLNVKLLELEQNYAKVIVPFKHEVIGDIRRNRWHGGLLATMMDSIGGLLGTNHFVTEDDKIATVDLRIDYLEEAKAEAIIVDAEIVRLGKRILITKMRTLQNGKVIAEGKGVYSIKINE